MHRMPLTNVVSLRIPPLRDRREDIPLLVAHFLERMKKNGGQPRMLSDAALRTMMEYSWPGNVRELDHAIERAVLMAQGTIIRPGDLALRTRDPGQRLEEMSLEDVEAFLIKKALARYSGNISQAADALGLSRSALYRRLQKYGLS